MSNPLPKRLSPKADLRLHQLTEAGMRNLDEILLETAKNIDSSHLLEEARKLNSILEEIRRTVRLL